MSERVIALLENRIADFLDQQLIVKQLNSPLGYLMLTSIIVATTGITVFKGASTVWWLIGLIVTVPMLVRSFFDLEFGVLLTITISFFVIYLRKFIDFPFGFLLDTLLVILLLGLLYQAIQERKFALSKHPISVMIYIWIGYNALQVLNPAAPSMTGWAYSIRSLALWLIIYFVALRVVNWQFVKRFIIVVSALMLFSALYGLKQEYIGFSQREMDWLMEDPLRWRLYFTWARLRVFSFFGDPTSFGIAMVYWGIVCLILATGPFAIWKRILLAAIAMPMLLVMAYTGSRTPMILLVIGAAFYFLMNVNWTTVAIGAVFAMAIGVFALKPNGNPVIFRMQSAFRPQEDRSMLLRLENQNSIQPYIQSHPIGAGLASIGVWGKRFNGGSWLANFAPDSAYVRVAVECGWIGLIIFMMLFGVILWTCIRYFFRVKDPTIKVVYLAFANMLFLITVANYPQEASYMIPTTLVFNVILAIVVRLKDFDSAYQLEESQPFASKQA
ncbi:MAG: O-antigen ligase family protein [Bacteroidota bacterium]